MLIKAAAGDFALRPNLSRWERAQSTKANSALASQFLQEQTMVKEQNA
jgi:hypothetical protein